MPKIVNCWNEWDPLKRVILGVPDGTVLSAPEPAVVHDSPRGGFPAGRYGPFPQEMVAKAREQMNAFAKILEDRGVTVDRPTPIDFNQQVSTPDWVQQNMRGCMPPRDVLLPVGEEIMETTMSLRSRWYEYLAYRPILEGYFRDDPDFVWTAAPKPRLTEDTYERNYWDNFRNHWTDAEKEVRHLGRKWVLTDKEPCFDAADAARCGKDIFWMASSVSNALGIDWVKRHFGRRGLRVHVVQFASGNGYFHPWHIDIEFTVLRPGLAVYNPDLYPIVPELKLLLEMNDWKLIPAARPVREYDCSPSLCGGEGNGTSWISMNTFSIDPETICVEAGETPYMEQLDKLGFNVIPVEFDAVYPLGGELHCSTVDVYREGSCEDYFPKQIPGF